MANESEKKATLRGQLVGFFGCLLVIGVALAAWFLVGGKVIFARAEPGNNGKGTMYVLP